RALAWGILAAAERSKVPVVYGAYPITPASDILHELALHKRFRVRTIQAEDEIAAITAAIGAAFGGAIGVTGSSGPGIALKGEAIGLAVTAELPLVIFDIQRGGPSTGLPTKTEQADLMQAMYGRNSESPVVVLAPATPGDCFYVAYEAVRIATKYMVPVMVLSDGFLANGSEPWLIPDPQTLPPIEIGFRTKTEQADLMQAMFGRNSESPVVVLAPATPGDCFYVAYEAVRIATKYMVPVMVLSDGFLANDSEPWLIPDPQTLPPIEIGFRTEKEGFFPYLRDPATLARPWVRPGT